MCEPDSLTLTAETVLGRENDATRAHTRKHTHTSTCIYEGGEIKYGDMLGRQRQTDIYELKDIVFYVVSSRPARTDLRSEALSQQQK